MSRLDEIYNRGLKALEESYKEKRGHKRSSEDPVEEETTPESHKIVLPPPAKPKAKKKAKR